MSGDGRYVAAAGGTRRDSATPEKRSDYPVLVWDLSSDAFQQPLATLIGHTAEVLSVSFSGDARRVLSSAADRTAVVWDIDRGVRVSTMRDHLDQKVWSAKFSPSEKEVVTACDDGRVRIWRIVSDSSEATKIQDFRGHEGPVYAADFTADGRAVISGGYDRRLIRWWIPKSSLSNSTDNTNSESNEFEKRLEGSFVNDSELELIGTEQQQHEASIRIDCCGHRRWQRIHSHRRER